MHFSYIKLHLGISSLLLFSCVSSTNTPIKLIEPIKVETTSLLNKNHTSQTIKGIVDSIEVEATLRLKPYHGKENHWLGTDGAVPELTIESLTVSRNGKTLDIPKILYSDFSDFSLHRGSLELHDTEQGFSLSYLGGDGAGAYGSTFYFDGEKLTRMTIGHLGMDKNHTIKWVTKQRYPAEN